MNFLKSFKDKIDELEKAKKFIEVTQNSLNKDAKELVQLIVQLLDNINKKKIIINIPGYNKTYYKIEHKISIGSNTIDHLHKNGAETYIWWKENSKDHFDSLWNFISGGNNNYIEIADVFNGLIKKYPENYKNIEINRTAKKYNIL
jgi:hypothetical protein